MDLTGIPSTCCINCGSKVILVKVVFDPEDYEIGMYFLDGKCNECGSLMTVPTPIDHPNNIKGEQ
jgi:rRNA maturation protein Nop10